MRFDRRKTYPLFDKDGISDVNILSDLVVETAIVPTRINGVIKNSGGIKQGKLPINRIAGILKNPYLYKIAASRMTRGGTSSFFGSRR